MIQIEYEKLGTIDAESGSTVLEISLKNGISHMHACGGNARCSTCRFLVLTHPENLSSITEAEQLLINERGFEDGVRLGCQAKVLGGLKIRLLLQDHQDYEDVRARKQTTTGREDHLAILFSDIRNFTGFSENHLPYDIIHLLNRYFEVMGQIVLDNGGYLDKYIGDGLMANFGLKQTDPLSICIRAVDAGLKMIKALEGINRYAKQQLDHEFRIGIGIHFGNVIVGELGHHSNTAFTVIGDAVNQASRIESMTKKTQAEILISQQVYEQVRNYVTLGRHFKAPLKGKTGEFHLYEILAIDPEIVKKFLTSGTELELREIKELNRETFAIIFEKIPNFEYTPGQFVDVKLEIEKPNGEKEIQSRSFTISSSPEENEIRFITRNTGTNFKKTLLKLSKGTKVHIGEPTGFLSLQPQPLRKHVFIAGGIGVTPFYSIIKNEFDSSSDSDILLLVSTREMDSLVYHKEFQKFESVGDRFRYIPTLTSDVPSDWSLTFERGRIDLTMIQKYVLNFHQALFYIAGSMTFTNSIRTILQDAGIVPSRIFQEDFLGY